METAGITRDYDDPDPTCARCGSSCERMTPARLRWIEREDLTAAGWREDNDGRWRHPDHGVMWPAWDGWRGVGLDGREVGPCGTALEAVARLTGETIKQAA